MAALLLVAARSASEIPALDSARQLVIVTAANWKSVRGIGQRFERASRNTAWRMVGKPFAITLGHHGMAWGRGLHPEPLADAGPRKAEGDKCAPAGIFKLGAAFGEEARVATALAYVHIDGGSSCIEETASRYYNRMIQIGEVEPRDFTSVDPLLHRETYRAGIFVEHNVAPALPGAGSCILLHIWRSPRTGTAGCTAMARAKLDALIGWLDRAKHPLLVQLPVREYARRRRAWRLP